MFLNAMHIRMGLIAVGILLGGWMFFGGAMGPKNTVIIEFGMYPNEFLGCTVEIDGEPRGELAKFGNALRTGFEVDNGHHEIRIEHPDLDCEPTTFKTDGGTTVTYILDIADVYRDGESQPVITFGY